MIKKLIMIALISSVAPQVHGMLAPEQLDFLEKQTCNGPLSAQNEEFIKNIMYEMNVNSSVKIRQPQTALAEIQPILNFHFYNPIAGIWYINEAWFNTLSQEERTFMISYGLEAIRSGSKQWMAILAGSFAVNAAVDIAVVYKSYKYISTYPTVFTMNNSATKSFLLSFAACGMLNAALLNPIHNYSVQKLTTMVAITIDQKVIQQLNCASGSLSYLKKMEQTIKPLYEEDKTYWEKFYVSFKPRIEAIEKSTSALNC